MKRNLIILCIVFSTSILAQSKDNSKKISLTSGYGLAGNFFVRAKDYAYKKNFLGTNLNFALGYKTGKKSGLELRFTREEFSKRIMYTDNVSIFVNSNTRHINNFFELVYNRALTDNQ